MPETIHETTITRRGSGWGFVCTCGVAPNVSSKQRKVAEARAAAHVKAAQS